MLRALLELEPTVKNYSSLEGRRPTSRHNCSRTALSEFLAALSEMLVPIPSTATARCAISVQGAARDGPVFMPQTGLSRASLWDSSPSTNRFNK